MGIELIGACIYCASVLFGVDMPLRPGLGAELGFSYSTLARKYFSATAMKDVSDVTPKFVYVGMGNNRQPEGDLGAGTPAWQWQLNLALAPSHDEQARRANTDNPQITATGTGRYENFAGLGRLPIGSRDSVEVAVERRNDVSTDTVNVGLSDHSISEERTISAERIDFGAGWRHRWPNFEASAAFRYVNARGGVDEAGSHNDGSGNLFGGELEARWRRARWTFVLHAERVAGTLNVQQASLPDFQQKQSKADSSLAALRWSVGYSWPRNDLYLAMTYDREKLPFSPLAVLGTESVAYDVGFRPDSSVKEIFWDLAYRHAFAERLRVRASVRMAWGNETMTLIDTHGGPSRTLAVKRVGDFGGGLSNFLVGPELAFAITAELFLGDGSK
jgi:hypothetical protein